MPSKGAAGRFLWFCALGGQTSVRRQGVFALCGREVTDCVRVSPLRAFCLPERSVVGVGVGVVWIDVGVWVVEERAG